MSGSGMAFEELLDRMVRCGDESELKGLVAEALRRSEGTAEREALFARADSVRRQHLGDGIHLRAVIEFSSHCMRDCFYCGLRVSNGRLRRYRMKPDEIARAALAAVDAGFRTVVLQSGEDPQYDAATLARLIRLIKQEAAHLGKEVAVTLSLGERSREELSLMKQAGADRYLLKHETSDEKLFSRLRPGCSLERRLQCLRDLRELGYQVGSGNIVGLPGQSLDSLAADLVLLKRLDVEMAGIGPFIPHPDTPLKNKLPGEVELTLRVLAVARLLLPQCHLPATTALSALDPEGRRKGLLCGANVVMPAVTPRELAQLYQIYPGKDANAAAPRDAWAAMQELAAQAGRYIDTTAGHSPKRGPWSASSAAGASSVTAGVSSLSSTPRGERLHIAIFGRRNAGKSSLINALAGQRVALVSDVPGTTTDPVYKAMEILPVGPVVLIDTAGIDDIGALGEMRVRRTYEVLDATDLPVLTLDPTAGVGEYELKIADLVRQKKLPLIVVITKADLVRLSSEELKSIGERLQAPVVQVSNKDGRGVDELKRLIIELCPPDYEGPPLLRDMLKPGELVVMVVPIDLEAPKGRLILPQVQALRDILDAGAVAIVTKEDRLSQVLNTLAAAGQKPRLVVTDSQAFGKVSRIVPEEIPLTSFSILFARHKGDLATLVQGARAVEKLRPGDKVLIAEACTHHPIGDDIGRKKIPTWLNQKVGGQLNFTWYAGRDFPADLHEYKLVVHCGGCMLNRKQMLSRLDAVTRAHVPIVNYGVLIAYLHGIMDRAVSSIVHPDGLDRA